MPAIISVVFCLKPRARGSSALFDSLHYISSLPEWDHVIVGWPGRDEAASGRPSTPVDARQIEAEIQHAYPTAWVVPVWSRAYGSPRSSRHFAVTMENKMGRFGDSVLYPLFHSSTNVSNPYGAAENIALWHSYEFASRSFAGTIQGIYKPGDLIWVHDYQLCLLPSMLRDCLPSATIGFFLQTPFPDASCFREFPQRKSVLEGILGATLVGFQAEQFADDFVESCADILDLRCTSRLVEASVNHATIDVFPTGIQAQETEKYAFERPGVKDQVHEIQKMYGPDVNIIVSRDRMNPASGLAQKLQGFETFLYEHPEWRGKVLLVQISNPEPGDPRSKATQTANRVADLIDRINGRFGSLKFAPILHFSQYIPQEEYFALLRIAKMCLITRPFDGMNTCGLEYIACQRESHGVLAVSESSSIAANIPGVTRFEVVDRKTIADSIHQSLTLSEAARLKKWEEQYRYVHKNTADLWVERYLARLRSLIRSQWEPLPPMPLFRRSLISQYRKTANRVFMFDYDGTLTPIVPDPEQAHPSAKLLTLLGKLLRDTSNKVWIISGRGQAFLSKHLGSFQGIGLSAEHGSFILPPGQPQWETMAAIPTAWREVVIKFFDSYKNDYPDSFVEQKKLAITWHYRLPAPLKEQEGMVIDIVAAIKRNLQRSLDNAKAFDAQIIEGKANIEVRPKGVNKGVVVRRILERDNPKFVLCMGDDHTDEDMFGAVNQELSSRPQWKEKRQGVFTVRVGAEGYQGQAKYTVDTPEETLGILEEVTVTSQLYWEEKMLASETYWEERAAAVRD